MRCRLLAALLLLCACFSIDAATVGPKAPDGTEPQIDLPDELQLRNVGGSDGAGLCVFTSLTHSARWQHVAVLEDFQQWMKKYPGGSWPQKTQQKIEQICKEKGVPAPDYVQIEGSKDMSILALACKTGRMPGVTYSRSPAGRYKGKIAHMVSMVHCDDKLVAILDNNFPKSQNLEWFSPQEFISVCNPGGYWAVILLDPPPPPPPSN